MNDSDQWQNDSKEERIQDQQGRPAIFTEEPAGTSFLERSIKKTELFYESRGKEGFPIVEASGKFRLKFIFAFPFCIIASLAILAIFMFIGAEFNPLLTQIEMLILFFAVTSTGWLTRSKLKSLAIFITWPIIYLVAWFFGIYNPLGMIPRILEGLGEILQLLPGGQLDVIFGQIPLIGLFLQQIFTFPSFAGALIDIIILFVGLFFMGSLLIAVISTGFWTEEGHFSKLSLIFKPICAVLLIIMLLIVPFTYHAATNVANGEVEFIEGVIGIMETVGLSNPFAFFNITDEAQRDAVQLNFTLASSHFFNARASFDQFRQNLLLGLLLTIIAINYPIGNLTINNDLIRDLSTILVYVAGGAGYFSQGAPKVIFGFTDMYQGLSKIIGIAGGQDETKQAVLSSIAGNEALLNESLEKIQKSADYFQAAREDLMRGLWEIFNITNLGVFNETLEYVEGGSEMANMIIGYGAGIPAIIDWINSTLPLVKALYYTFTGTALLARSNFTGGITSYDISQQELLKASNILGAISPDSRAHSDIVGLINAFRDIARLFIPYIGAGKSSIGSLLGINDIMTSFQEVDNITLADPYDPWWAIHRQILSNSAGNMTDAVDYVNNASAITDEILEKVNNSEYGSFSSQIGQIVQGINAIMGVGGFIANVTGMVNLVQAFDYTFQGMWALSYGYNESQDFANLPEPAKTKFIWAKANATLANDTLQTASGLDNQTIQTLSDIITTINNAADIAIPLCDTATDPDEFDTVIDQLNIIQNLIDGLFGGNGGSIRSPKQPVSHIENLSLLSVSQKGDSNISPSSSLHITNQFLPVVSALTVIFSLLVVSCITRKRYRKK
ncbi:MAG: hypothetical protein ACFFC7_18170 [Candidatus Hermodarchaeota archaeon]